MFVDHLASRVRAHGPTCVGLDPHLALLPEVLRAPLPAPDAPGYRRAAAEAVRRFSAGVIEAVAPHAAALKPQVAFFEALGAPGVEALEEAVSLAKQAGLAVVLDAKRGDIGTTAEAYAVGALDDAGPLGADAVTLSPYLGAESLAPFVRRCPGKGLFVLVRTSNPGSGLWQLDTGLAERVAAWITAENARLLGSDGLGPIGAVVGATLPGEAAMWRERLPNAWILVPGYGAQGGTAADVRALLRPDGLGALVVSARGVLFPPGGQDDGAAWQDAIGQRAAAFAADLHAITGAGAAPGGTAHGGRS